MARVPALLAVAALLSTADIVSTDAQKLTASGDAKLAAGDASAAAADYRAAIAADASAFEARVNLGAALLRVGDAEGAAASLEDARKVRPDHAALLRNLGRAYLKLDRWDEAADALRKAREEDPSHEEGTRLLGIALGRAGRHADAIPLLREAATARAKDAELLVELAEAEANAGDPIAAAKTVDRARKVGGTTGADAARVRNNLGLLLRRLGRNADALAEFRAAAKADPTYGPAVANLGMALFESGDAKAAVGTLATAAKKDPDPEIRFQLGQARLAIGDAKGAIADLEYARSWGYDPRRIAAQLALCHEKLGDAKRAESERAKMGGGVWTQTIADARAAKAYQAFNAGRHQEAMPLFAELASKDPTDAKAHLGLGVSRYWLGDVAGAVEALEKTVRLLPSDGDSWYYLGAARKARGDRDGAIDAWNRAIELFPRGSDRASNLAANLGRLLVQSGRAGDAVSRLAAAAKALPKNLDVQHDYAVALLASGDAAAAARVLAGYVAARPADLPAAEAQADALRKSGEHAKAAAAFESLAKKQPQVSRHAVNAAVSWRAAGNRRNEKAWLEKAAALAPEDAEIANDLGRLSYEDEDWPSAERLFARAAKLDPSNRDAAANAETARKARELAEMKSSRLHLGILLVKDKATADQVIAALKKKGSFAELAKKHSTHESAGNGGNLGWVDPAQMPEWAAPAKSLAKGQTSAPIEVQGLGFAIFTRYPD